MMYPTYILPGDSVKAGEQSYHFTKDKTYKVSNVSIHKGEVVHFIIDDYGVEVPMGPFNFDTTEKTNSLIEERRINTRLDFIWENRIENFVDAKNIYDRSKTFSLSFAHFCNVNPTPLAGIQINNIIAPNTPAPDGTISTSPRYISVAPYTYLYSKEDFYDYVKNYVKNTQYCDFLRNIHLPASHIDAQEAIDKLSYLNSTVLKKLEVTSINEFSTKKIHNLTELSWETYLDEIAKFIFRKNTVSELSVNEKQIIIDIMDLFVILPSSYGSTAVAKILNGTGNIKNKKAEEYKGKYKKQFSYTQLFETADAINIYMHHNNIFTNKETYCSSDEWRGQFEFIGNTTIDITKLLILKNVI